LGWIGATPEQGVYDLAEYEHYDDPANGELHIVVPDKFLAFRGPKSLPEGVDYDDSDGVRRFAARYYVEIFQELGVTTVVRLNEPQYDETIFKDAGLDHHDLEVHPLDI
jgi:cell division cycle 14